MKKTMTANKFMKDIVWTIDNYNDMLKYKYSTGDYAEEDEAKICEALETLFKVRKLIEKETIKKEMA